MLEVFPTIEMALCLGSITIFKFVFTTLNTSAWRFKLNNIVLLQDASFPFYVKPNKWCLLVCCLTFTWRAWQGGRCQNSCHKSVCFFIFIFLHIKGNYVQKYSPGESQKCVYKYHCFTYRLLILSLGRRSGCLSED